MQVVDCGLRIAGCRMTMGQGDWGQGDEQRSGVHRLADQCLICASSKFVLDVVMIKAKRKRDNCPYTLIPTLNSEPRTLTTISSEICPVKPGRQSHLQD